MCFRCRHLYPVEILAKGDKGMVSIEKEEEKGKEEGGGRGEGEREGERRGEGGGGRKRDEMK